MRKSILIAVMLAVVLVAVPAHASVQNVKISGSIDSSYVWRSQFDFGETVGANDDTEEQSLFITQTTLQVDADLTDQVSATIGLINERVWNNNAAISDDSDSTQVSDVSLYRAFITLREMLYSPLTVIIGRQDFRYGNSFIMDSAGPNSGIDAPTDSGLDSVAEDLTKQTALDAIRAIFDYDPLTIEVVFAVLNSNETNFVTASDNEYLWGTNATYELGDDLDSVVEGYFWVRKDKETHTDGTDQKIDVLKVFGVRGSTNPIEGLNLQAEIAKQLGTDATGTASENRQYDGIGVQAIANYQIPYMEEYNPMLTYAFTKVTGDNGSGDTDVNSNSAWQPFFENQGGGRIYNTLFSLSNAIIHEATLSFNPMEDVTTKVTYVKLWTEKDLKSSTITLLQPDGSTEAVSAVEGKNGLGQEFDIEVLYDYTEDVQFGVNAGMFWPGNVFTDDVENIAKQVIANVSLTF